MLRANASWTDDAWFLIEEAARHGHGDAERLLAAAAGPVPTSGITPRTEDPSFFEELRRLLDIPLHCLQPDPHPTLPDPGRQPGPAPKASRATEREDEERQPGRTGLVLVPAPVLPTQYGAAPRPRTTPEAERRRLTALTGGLALPVPDPPPTVAARPFTVHGSVYLRGEPWWSASALRPAILTDMARHSTTPAVVPARWQTTQRARDMLLLIHDTDGIDTRTLARRTRMPMNSIVRLLDWLRDERFVETIAGAHFPGPLMADNCFAPPRPAVGRARTPGPGDTRRALAAITETRAVLRPRSLKVKCDHASRTKGAGGTVGAGGAGLTSRRTARRPSARSERAASPRNPWRASYRVAQPATNGRRGRGAHPVTGAGRRGCP